VLESGRLHRSSRVLYSKPVPADEINELLETLAVDDCSKGMLARSARQQRFKSRRSWFGLTNTAIGR